MKFWVTAAMPAISGAATLVPPNAPLLTPPVVLELARTRIAVFVSAIAEMSGTERPGHGAFAETPAPFCQLGRATMFEHQLPAAVHTSSVLSTLGLVVEKF